MTPFSAEDTSLSAAQANVLASSTDMMNHLNSELKNRYARDFENWKISVLAGRGDTVTMPKPPNAYVLVKDDEGFTFPALGKLPVCDPLPVPDTSGFDHGTGSSVQTEYLKQHHPMAVGETPDNPPVGTEVTNPVDQTRWRKVLLGITPFGKACEWIRV